MAQFTTIKLVSSVASFKGIQPGQWVEIETGPRGQYLGTTARGVAVVRWQQGDKFAKRDAINNKHLRNFAKVYGSK